MRDAARVFPTGCPGGQIASTRNPALASATANRAVGTQFVVVTIKAVGFKGGFLGSAVGVRWRSEVDELATLAERLARGFKHAYHFQSRAAAIEWSFAFRDAFREVLQLNPESFDLFDLRRPHVAGAVTYQQVVHTFLSLHVHALVVDLELFVGFEIVPYQHFLFAPDQCGSNFDRGDPI